MKIACPHCQQPLDAPNELAGKSINCPACQGVFIIPIPTANIIMVEPAKKQSSYNIATRLKKAKSEVITGVIFISVSIIGFIISACFENAIGFLGISLILVIPGLLLLNPDKRIQCTCGYKGMPETVSAPSGCAFILLLCIGILPGLIYYFAIPTILKCPQCGASVKKSSLELER